MISKLINIYDTVKDLKAIQIRYRIFYFLRKKYRKIANYEYPAVSSADSWNPILQKSLDSSAHFNNNSFAILNRSKKFEKNIDWNFKDYGKLWTYNLNYFEYLNDPQIVKETGLVLIYDFIEKFDTIQEGLDAYPISLRCVNWIKFLTRFKVEDKIISNSIFKQYLILCDNLEYQHLANHFLENIVSLLHGAYFFKDDAFYELSKKNMEKELKEQFLEDGAHFELSPMYHQLILFRLLDCFNLINNNQWKQDDLKNTLVTSLRKALSWLEKITFANGDIPLVNDSAFNVAPSSSQLLSYAELLGITWETIPFSDSGYRKIKKGDYEIVVDVGPVGPKYNPAHAHSDTFNFLLYKNNYPLIVDCGTSTYDRSKRRHLERSTVSHNTVEIGCTNQSEVWASFRVGRKAETYELFESGDEKISAKHDGYKHLGYIHKRTWEFFEHKIIILDEVEGGPPILSKAFLHFGPDVQVILQDNIVIGSDFCITFKNEKEITIKSYSFASEFNLLKKAQVVQINFYNNLVQEIKL